MGRKSLAFASDMRQGQTVYFVDMDMSLDVTRESFTVRACFLHSHKVALPPKGEMIVRLPVSRARQLQAVRGTEFYRSREKAQDRAELEARRWGV